MIQKLIGAILVSFGVLAAQPVITHGPKVTNVSHSSVRVVWITDVKPTSTEIEWGLTTAYGKTLAARLGYKDTAGADDPPYTSTVTLVGLTPGTTYHARARLDGGAVLSGDVTFTTAAEPAIHPEPPAAPVEVDVTMPVINGNTYNVQPDCANLPSILDALGALTGSANHEIVIPAGTQCYGNFIFPARPNHTGWIVVRSSAAGTSAFPPEGVRWTPNWPISTTLASFVTRTLGVTGVTSQTSISSATCNAAVYYEGGFVRVTGLPSSLFPLERCSASYPAYNADPLIDSMSGSLPVTVTATGHGLQEGQIIYIPTNGYVAANKYYVYSVTPDTFRIYASGSGSYTGGVSFTVYNQYRLPPHQKSSADPSGSCTEFTWWYNTSSQRLWWCAQSAWVEFTLPPTYTTAEYAAIRVNGHKYRFIGLEVTSQQVAGAPDSFPEGWGTYTGLYGTNYQGLIWQLIEQNGNYATFDRCYIHGHPKPARVRRAISMNGSDFALIESYTENFQEWRYHAPETAADYSQSMAAYVVQHNKGNRILLRNNHLEAAGITYMAPNPNSDGTGPNMDVVARRNTFRKRPEWRRTGSQPWQYPNRHSFELKQGRRVLVEGNLFDYQWSGINAASFVMATAALPYSMPSAFTINSWSNGVLSLSGSGYFNTGDVIYVAGTDPSHNGMQEVAANACPANCQQVTLLGTFSGSGAGGTAKLRALGPIISDLTVRNNSFYQGTEWFRAGSSAGCVPGGYNLFCILPLMRAEFSNNLIVDLDIRAYASGGRVDLDYFRGLWPDYGGRMLYLVRSRTVDFAARHNTGYLNRGDIPVMLNSDGDTLDVNEGLLLSDNAFTFDHTAFSAVRGGSAAGTTTLNERSKRDDTPQWISQGNVMCCGWSSYSGSYPSGYRWPAAVADVKWLNPSAATLYNFRLRHDSPYISGGASRASDDKDIGVDMDALEAAQGRVTNIRVHSLGPTSATIGYLAPDSAACTVEYGASATWGTGTRVSDGGGDRARNVALGSLSSGTNYHYRVLCAVEQPSGSFRTP